jgi:ankyrin repeat protein
MQHHEHQHQHQQLSTAAVAASSPSEQQRLDAALVLATRTLDAGFQRNAIARNLLAQGASARARSTPDGTPALHWSAWSKFSELISLLLMHNADVHACNGTGQTGE